MLLEKHNAINGKIGYPVFDSDFPIVVQDKRLPDVVFSDRELHFSYKLWPKKTHFSDKIHPSKTHFSDKTRLGDKASIHQTKSPKRHNTLRPILNIILNNNAVFHIFNLLAAFLSSPNFKSVIANLKITYG